MTPVKPLVFWPLALFVAGAALAFDISQPLGVAGGVPYVLLVLMGLAAGRTATVVLLTVVASALTVLGYELSVELVPLEVAIINRGLALFTQWSVAIAIIAVTRQRQTLERQSNLDPLTRAYNRHSLHTDLARAIGDWQDGRQPFCLVMLDLDHFKTINDRFGHPAGDSVLREVAALAAGSIRDGDRLYRFGGEEFLIVLPGANQREACDVAERIRLRVNHAPLSVGAKLTVSLGVAEMDERYQNGEELLQAVDKALYQSKRAGRNQVNLEQQGRLIPFPANQRS